MAKELSEETRETLVKELMDKGGILESDARRSVRIMLERLDKEPTDEPLTMSAASVADNSIFYEQGITAGLVAYPDDNMKNPDAKSEPTGPYDHCPQRVRIGARTWKVRWWDHRTWAEEKMDENNKGLTEVANSNIYIRTSRIYQDSGVEVQYDWQSLAETFLHECLHAMLWDTSLDRYPRSPNGKWDQEEYMVVQLAPRLQAFMLDNPHALAWVKDTATA